MRRRVFTQEFKETAVRLAGRPGAPVEQVARELGIATWTLRRWMRETVGTSRKTPPPRGTAGVGDAGAAADGDLRRRVRQLEAENQRLRTERDILKKAAAFFARDGLEEGRP